MDYWFSASHEMFPPSALLEQAQAAAQAGTYADHVLPALRGARVSGGMGPETTDYRRFRGPGPAGGP